MHDLALALENITTIAAPEKEDLTELTPAIKRT